MAANNETAMQPGQRCVRHADEMHGVHDYDAGTAARWRLQDDIGRCPYVEPAASLGVPPPRHIGYKVTGGRNHDACSACLHPFDDQPDYPPCESTLGREAALGSAPPLPVPPTPATCDVCGKPGAKRRPTGQGWNQLLCDPSCAEAGRAETAALDAELASARLEYSKQSNRMAALRRERDAAVASLVAVREALECDRAILKARTAKMNEAHGEVERLTATLGRILALRENEQARHAIATAMLLYRHSPDPDADSTSLVLDACDAITRAALAPVGQGKEPTT